MTEPTEEQIQEYINSASEEDLLNLVWQAVTSSDEAMNLVLGQIDDDTGPARAALEEAAREVAGSQ